MSLLTIRFKDTFDCCPKGYGEMVKYEKDTVKALPEELANTLIRGDLAELYVETKSQGDSKENKMDDSSYEDKSNGTKANKQKKGKANK